MSDLRRPMAIKRCVATCVEATRRSSGQRARILVPGHAWCGGRELLQLGTVHACELFEIFVGVFGGAVDVAARFVVLVGRILFSEPGLLALLRL